MIIWITSIYSVSRMAGLRWAFCLLLLILSRSARFDEDDRHVDRVVFGLEGQAVFFPRPEGNWWARQWTWPAAFEYYTKIYLLGEAAARTGFVVKNFRPEDQGRKYSVTTDQEITTYYRAVLATRIEVDVGATLHITPKIRGEIIWKYTPTSITKATDFVKVLRHGALMNRARVDAATGKLSISDWRSCDDGFFTAVINGEEFAANFNVVSIVRVTPGGDLLLDPNFVGHISQFTWYRINEPVVEFTRNGGGLVYRFLHCLTVNGNCDFDRRTGKLTIKSWQHSYNGVFTMKINGQLQPNGIKVVGDVIFVPSVENMLLMLPPFKGDLNSIIWKHGGNLAAEYYADGDLEYFTICSNDNCILDKTTGKLTVKTWDPSNDKTLTVELNHRTLPYEYVVVKKLDGYDASVKTQAITDKITNLICAGDFDGAEPVKYLWRLRGTSGWVQGTKIMETKHILVGNGLLGNEYDACKIRNPVSERVIVLNP